MEWRRFVTYLWNDPRNLSFMCLSFNFKLQLHMLAFYSFFQSNLYMCMYVVCTLSIFVCIPY